MLPQNSVTVARKIEAPIPEGVKVRENEAHKRLQRIWLTFSGKAEIEINASKAPGAFVPERLVARVAQELEGAHYELGESCCWKYLLTEQNTEGAFYYTEKMRIDDWYIQIWMLVSASKDREESVQKLEEILNSLISGGAEFVPSAADEGALAVAVREGPDSSAFVVEKVKRLNQESGDDSELLTCPLCGSRTAKIVWGGCDTCRKAQCPFCSLGIPRRLKMGLFGSDCPGCGKAVLCTNKECGAPLTQRDKTCPHCKSEQPNPLTSVAVQMLGCLGLLIGIFVIIAILVGLVAHS